jgi:hypothetical protein
MHRCSPLRASSSSLDALWASARRIVANIECRFPDHPFASLRRAGYRAGVGMGQRIFTWLDRKFFGRRAIPRLDLDRFRIRTRDGGRPSSPGVGAVCTDRGTCCCGVVSSLSASRSGHALGLAVMSALLRHRRDTDVKAFVILAGQFMRAGVLSLSGSHSRMSDATTL